VRPDLDAWLAQPALRVHYGRDSRAAQDELWSAARGLRLSETGLLGRLVRWRIPGLRRELTVDELFREPPFMILEEGEQAIISGLVGRIWTLRRDYPRLDGPEEFREWSKRGTARVVFAHWVQASEKGATLNTEVRIQAFGTQGRLGLAAVRPLVRRFGPLVSSGGIAAAIRAAEGRPAPAGADPASVPEA
jgi:hypothetical protein